MNSEARPHALYRFFGANDELLYVGITCDLGRRMSRHAQDKPWWTEVRRTTVEHFDSRDAVLAAERSAVMSEAPAYNVRLRNGKPTTPPEDVTPTPSVAHGCVREGDVVAIGTVSGECPVGYVDDVDDFGIRLALMDFGWGTFDQGPRVIFWEHVVDIRHARERDDSERETKESRIWSGNEKTRVFDTDALGEFQTRWRHAHMPRVRCSECGREELIDRLRLRPSDDSEICSSCEFREKREKEDRAEERERARARLDRRAAGEGQVPA